MGIVAVRTVGFRNLADGELDLHAPEVFLVGENGQGKTNLLEAVYLLCYGSSFRTRKDEQLCHTGVDAMSVAGIIDTQKASRTRIAVRLERERKSIERDGKPVRDRKELIEVMPCIVFCHGDIGFVTGAPEMQRTFFDQTLSLYQPSYIDLLRRYRRVLKLRNSVLKQQQRSMLEIYDQQLVEAGFELQRRRAALVSEFNETFSRVFRAVSGLPDEVNIRYRPSWRVALPPEAQGSDQGEEIQEADLSPDNGGRLTREALAMLAERRERDLALGTTTSGPHRDRYRYSYREREFTEIASTGQVRLVSLILRSAQAVFFAAKTGLKPVLLLDDVLLELDTDRRERFLERLPEYEQAIYTFLPDEPFSRYAKTDTLLYRVSEGRFTRREKP